MRNIEIKLEIGTLFTKPYEDGWIRTSNPRVEKRIDPRSAISFEVRIYPSP
jgi:hypothetical protein